MSAQLPVYVCTFGSNGNSRTCERTGIVGNDACSMSARLELARVRSAVRRASSLHQRLQHPPTKRGLHGGSNGQCSMKNAGPARDIVRRNNSIRAPARDPPTRGMLIEGGARADRAGIRGGDEVKTEEGRFPGRGRKHRRSSRLPCDSGVSCRC